MMGNDGDDGDDGDDGGDGDGGDDGDDGGDDGGDGDYVDNSRAEHSRGKYNSKWEDIKKGSWSKRGWFWCFLCQKKMGEKKSQKVGSAKTVLVIYWAGSGFEQNTDDDNDNKENNDDKDDDDDDDNDDGDDDDYDNDDHL